jgi:uncharacterized protein (DUF362 family)/ferredoxin-like protein FixX
MFYNIMNNKVAVRECHEYDADKIYNTVSDIYRICEGPVLDDRKVLVKPNILTDDDPSRCISTHPAVVEAVIRFLQTKNARVFVGDSPAVHLKNFRGVKSGIADVCSRTGAEWVDFTKETREIKLRKGKIKIAAIASDIDLIISLPKFKNHELVYFTGAIKNTLGLVPGFAKAKQHALYQNRDSFSLFLVDLNEAILPHFFIMDGITGMEGKGPSQGNPVDTGVLIGSSNPVALDYIASTIAGYNPVMIPTTRIAISRQKWLLSPDDIIYDGPDLERVIKHDFRRILQSRLSNIAVRFVTGRVRMLRRLERRPVFIQENCTGCRKCITICPMKAIEMHKNRTNHVILTDSKCIRCFCCSEVCPSNAVEIKLKLFGA